MAEKMSMIQLTGGSKDGHIFTWQGSLPRHLFFSPDPADNDPDMISPIGKNCLVYERVDRHVDISSGRMFEFFTFVKYRSIQPEKGEANAV